MNRKKLTGWLAGLAGVAAAIVLVKQPHHSAPAPPAPPNIPRYTLVVHVCAGPCEQDHKIPSAVASMPDRPDLIMDGAGNGFWSDLPAGRYPVCVEAAGYKRLCAEHSVPAEGEASFELERDAPPIAALHSDGRIFRLADGQAWRWRGVSAFQLLDRFARGDDITPVLEAYRGFNLLRVWCYTPTKDWGSKAWDVPTADQARAFLAFVGARGWYVELTLLTDDDPARLAWARGFAPALAGLPNVLLEIGNEPETHKAIDTAALVPVIYALGVPWTTGNYEDAAKMRGTYGVAHTARDGEWPRRVHDLLDYYQGGGPNAPSDPAHHFPIIADEPAKLQDVSGNRPQDWLAYFAAASLLGGGATFHSETGKYGQPPTADEAVLAAAALRGLTAFPADAPNGGYSRTDEGGATLRTYTVGGCTVRIRPTDGVVLPR